MGKEPQKQAIFEPLTLRSRQFRNRIWVPAMCQYMSTSGSPTSWHEAHYAGLATGTGCVIVEATAVAADARVTPQDLVLDTEAVVPAFARIAQVIADRGAVAGLQLSHAGRKGSRTRPWEGDVPIALADGGWPVVAPTSEPFAAGYPSPIELDEHGMARIADQFAKSAALAVQAGFRLVEIHAGHGRLLHSFLSPISNRRTDEHGESLAGRSALLRRVTALVRASLPVDVVLSVRLSCVDWCEGGLTLEDSVTVAGWLREDGADIVNCSSGGIVKPLRKAVHPGYQVGFAREIRQSAGIATGAVGLITSFEHANEVLERGDADVVLMGRRLLLDPFALLRHAAASGEKDLVPAPYLRAFNRTPKPDEEGQLVPEL